MSEEKKNSSLQSVMETAMKNIKEMVDVNTIIGDPINCADGTIIIPVSKVNFGFASGGSDFNTKSNVSSSSGNPLFGGGSGAGVSIVPIAFLVVSSKGVSLLPIDQPSYAAIDKIIDGVPDLIEKAKDVFGKKD